MKKITILLLTLLLLSGCMAAGAETRPQAASKGPTAAPTMTLAAVSMATDAPTATQPETAAPETAQPDAGLAGTVLQLTQGLIATPSQPQVELELWVAAADLTGAPEGRDCLLRLWLDGKALGRSQKLRVRPGASLRIPLEFSFTRYQPDRQAELTAALYYGTEECSARAWIRLKNDSDELWAARSGDPQPYSIDVIRSQNVVVVYGKDETGAWTVPVKSFLCSTGRSTPQGNYSLGPKREWGLLFGNVYGQYVSRITGDILFHSVPYYRKDKGSLETEEFNKLGTTASLGCVRMAVGDVKWIYDFCPSGTPVRIYDADQLPVEMPTALVLDPADPRSGWDPTDPDPENPWLQDWQLTAKEATP